jgi:acyl-CoA-binding protein
MMASISSKKLSRLYDFFKTYGTERLNGLDESYFFDFTDSEKEEAWDFLKNGFLLSADCITGLYLLDQVKAVELFKHALDVPTSPSQYPAERQASESNHLLMLKYINSVDLECKYVNEMNKFANSEFSKIRAEFASSLPTDNVTQDAVNALKSMIFTETERIPLTTAITKLMAIHGMDYDIENPTYKSIYLSLRSDDNKKKTAGIHRLEKNSLPQYR